MIIFKHCDAPKIECGRSKERNARLLGGTDLAPFEFPWLVQVQTYGLATVPGTLINDRYVLTAATPLKKLRRENVEAKIST